MKVTGDLHHLGLGILERVTKEIDNDCNTTGTFETLKPAYEHVIQEMIPEKHVEVHPLAYVGLRILNKILTGKDFQTVDVSKELMK